MLLQNLIAWVALHTAIHQILFRQFPSIRYYVNHFTLHTISSVSTEKLYFPTCSLIVQQTGNNVTTLYCIAIFEGEKFRGFLSGLENFTLEHFDPSKMPRKASFQSQV